MIKQIKNISLFVVSVIIAIAAIIFEFIFGALLGILIVNIPYGAFVVLGLNIHETMLYFKYDMTAGYCVTYNMSYTYQLTAPVTIQYDIDMNFNNQTILYKPVCMYGDVACIDGKISLNQTTPFTCTKIDDDFVAGDHRYSRNRLTWPIITLVLNCIGALIGGIWISAVDPCNLWRNRRY